MTHEAEVRLLQAKIGQQWEENWRLRTLVSELRAEIERLTGAAFTSAPVEGSAPGSAS